MNRRFSETMRSSSTSRRAANELARGTALGMHGRYEIVEMINRGGTAVVYRGIDREKDGGEIALKCIDVSSDARVVVPLAAVKREIKYATRLMGGNGSNAGVPGVVRLLCVETRARCALGVRVDSIAD